MGLQVSLPDEHVAVHQQVVQLLLVVVNLVVDGLQLFVAMHLFQVDGTLVGDVAGGDGVVGQLAVLVGGGRHAQL